MVHFFGIFSPGIGPPSNASEAPNKRGFFGGAPDQVSDQTAFSRAELDACYLTGKTWEPDALKDVDARPCAFVSRYTP